MGRRRKYFSNEEKLMAHAYHSKIYYWNNRDECVAKANERYHKKKLENVSGSIDNEEISLNEIDIQEIDGKQ